MQHRDESRAKRRCCFKVDQLLVHIGFGQLEHLRQLRMVQAATFEQ